MKKIIIFILMMCLMVVGVSATNTDFSAHYLQSYGAWNEDTYSNDNGLLLRATSSNTSMDYTLDTWDFCSVTLGGSEFGGVPISLYDFTSTFKHSSYIVTYDTSIKQYGVDCSVIDTYSMGTNRTIVSKMGVVKSFRSATGYSMPTFAVVNYNNYTDKTYMTILTLDSENSTLILDKDLLISNTANFTNTDDVFGTTGGCINEEITSFVKDGVSGSSIGCDIDDRVFGVYNVNDNDLRIINHLSGDWSLAAQVDVGNTYIDNISNNNMLFFNDYSGDGNNVFIFLGFDVNASDDEGIFYNSRIQPLSYAPYYYKFSRIKSTASMFASKNDPNRFSDYQSMNVCQIGSKSSPMEVCFNIHYQGDTGTKFNYAGFLGSDFTTRYFSTQIGTGVGTNSWIINPFTYTIDDEIVICYPKNNGYFKCATDNNTMVSNFTILKDINVVGDYPLELFVTDLDGDLLPELLYSDGTVENINFDGVNTVSTDWDSTFGNSYHGELISQDISNDNKNDLIYIDDTFLRIYTNDDSAFVLLNFTYLNATEGTDNESSLADLTDDEVASLTGLDSIFGRISLNIKLIFGLFLIIGLIIASVKGGVTNPMVLMLVGIVGAVISTALGLISTGVLILMIVSMTILLILGMTMFNKRE